jgi:hypothetical protein
VETRGCSDISLHFVKFYAFSALKLCVNISALPFDFRIHLSTVIVYLSNSVHSALKDNLNSPNSILPSSIAASSTMLRSSLNASRQLIPRPQILISQPILSSSCSRNIPIITSIGCRSMAVAANANSSDAPLITPGTPISTPTLIDIDKRWLDLTAQQQLDIFKALHEREKEPWYTMTTEERKACMSPYIPE